MKSYEERLISLLNKSVTIETFDGMYIFGSLSGFQYSNMGVKQGDEREVYPTIMEIELNNDPELRVKIGSIKEITVKS